MVRVRVGEVKYGERRRFFLINARAAQVKPNLVFAEKRKEERVLYDIKQKHIRTKKAA